MHWICHNAAFDFWVVERHLRDRGEEQAVQAWWTIASSNRLHDSMILDMLVRLAKDDSYPDMRDLAVIARRYAGLEVSKDDPYRMRYGEIINKDWPQVEEGFFDYAIRDAIVTRPAYAALRKQALAIVEQFGRHSSDILPEARQKFGLLTEAIQVKKAIALADITRNGMCIDVEWVRQAEAELRARLEEAVGQVQTLCPGLYKTDKQGSLVRTGKAKAPSKSTEALLAKLQEILAELKEAGLDLSIPVTPKGRKLSTSKKVWQEYQDHHAFLRHWVMVEELAKLLQFFEHLRQEVVHPGYTVMVRTGRTSCSGPQQKDAALARPLEDLCRLTVLLAEAVLIGQGYHRHGGEWRRPRHDHNDSAH
jgi:DNA polymerase I-like protein with 3'-5' exonuclease and polymerase domains